MVTDTITTGPDNESETIMFAGDTPSLAYEALTDAVYSAKFYREWVQIDIERIPPNTKIGSATYDEESGKISSLLIREEILEEFGHKA